MIWYRCMLWNEVIPNVVFALFLHNNSKSLNQNKLDLYVQSDLNFKVAFDQFPLLYHELNASWQGMSIIPVFLREGTCLNRFKSDNAPFTGCNIPMEVCFGFAGLPCELTAAHHESPLSKIKETSSFSTLILGCAAVLYLKKDINAMHVFF